MAQNIICNDNNRKHTHKICHFVPYKLYIFICLSNFTHTHRISFNSMLSLLWLFFHSKVSNKVPTSSIFIFNWAKLNTLRKFTINSSSSSNFNFLGSAFFIFSLVICVISLKCSLSPCQKSALELANLCVLWHFRFIK